MENPIWLDLISMIFLKSSTVPEAASGLMLFAYIPIDIKRNTSEA
jgi:hypothetical protein